jgi:hypothetical protein
MMEKELDPQEVYDQMIADVYTTALEGGINYWSCVHEYKWSDGNGNSDVSGFRAVIQEIDEETKYIINKNVIEKGYKLATEDFRDSISWSTDYPPHKDEFFKSKIMDLENPWDFDAGDADCILQLGIFGEVIFG